VIATHKGKRIGLYASLDEALNRRNGHPVGTLLVRVGDGELMARYKNHGGLGA
jgi:hypothetical protein